MNLFCVQGLVNMDHNHTYDLSSGETEWGIDVPTICLSRTKPLGSLWLFNWIFGHPPFAEMNVFDFSLLVTGNTCIVLWGETTNGCILLGSLDFLAFGKTARIFPLNPQTS